MGVRHRIFDTSDPRNYYCTTYLWSNETAHSVTSPDCWFPIGVVPMNYEGVIYDSLMDGTEIKVCTLLIHVLQSQC